MNSLDSETVGVVAILVTMLILVAVAYACAHEDKGRFMAQCSQDHKEYECVAMWRGGRSSRGYILWTR